MLTEMNEATETSTVVQDRLDDHWECVPRLEQCPDCGYCLTGLPADHRCPECGFEFGPDTAAWTQGNFFKLVRVSILGYGLVAVSIYTSTIFRTWAPDSIIAAIVVMAAWGFLIARDVRRIRRLPVVVLDRAGLKRRDGGDELTKVSWSEVREITLERRGRRIVARVAFSNGLGSLEMSSMLGRDPMTHERFARTAQAYLQHRWQHTG